MRKRKQLFTRIKICIWIIIIGLALSGITAFPLCTELNMLVKQSAGWNENLRHWLIMVDNALNITASKFPFLNYGTDWLAFAHVMLAVLFVGPLRDPVRNVWVIEFGMIACVSIFPLAFIAGTIRGIPFFWQLIDCSFGVFAFIPLYIAYTATKQLTIYSDKPKPYQFI